MLIGKVRGTGYPPSLAFENFVFDTVYLELEAKMEENIILPARLKLT